MSEQENTGRPTVPDVTRRTLLRSAAIGTVAGLGATAAVAQDDNEDGFLQEGPTVGLETVAEELTAPVDFQVADEETDRRFVVDQTGQIYVHGEDGLEDEPFLDISDRMVDLREDFDERGLLGLALHPDFEENGRFFVRYSAPPREETPEEWSHTFVLSEFETEGDDNESADPDSEQVLLEIDEPQPNHNSGMVAFGPDGYLYVSTGDGGGANDNDEGHVEDWYDENEGGNGQDTTENLLGAVLRIDVDEGTGEGEDDDAGDGTNDRAYGIPEDNPFAEQGEFDSDEGLPEQYAWGLRNPWGSMDFHGDRMLLADVGQNLFEEVNAIEKGGNYGWNVKEGTHCFSTESPEEVPDEEDCPDETPDDVRGGEELIDPVIEYPQEYEGEPIGVSIIGGHLYDGDTVSGLEETYVFGDWSGPLFLARPPEGWLEDEGMDDEGDGDDIGNGNDNETDDAGNETDAGGDGDMDASGDGEDELWPMERLVVEADDLAAEGALDRNILAFGQDSDGEVYVLTTENTGPTGETGQVHRIVEADGDGSDGDAGAEGEDEEAEEAEEAEEEKEEGR
ncbi:PQQ-dependent sugar dehydrogenase [Saliphagus sp. GCM10025317]